MTPEVKERIEQLRHGIVPEGYTASGKHPIPNDWETTLIGSIAQLSSGCTPSRKNPEYWNGDIPWVTTGELEQKYITKTKERVTRNALDNTTLNIYPSGTLLMAMYGQGKTRGSTAILGIDATINQACLAINTAESSTKYLFYVLQHSYHSIRKLSNTGNQENLNADIIRSFPIPWAPMNEQLHICQILTAQDNVIELKEKLLTEKQRQKKYLMQQLLTGRKRLPGFAGEWDTKALGEISNQISEKAGDNRYEVLSISANKGFVNQSEKFGKDISGAQYSKYTVIRRGQFSYNKGNSKHYPQGCIYLLEDREVAAVPNVFISFELSQTCCNEYYKYLFEAGYMNRQLYRLINSGVRNDGLLNLNDSDFFACNVPMPPFEEQVALSRILTEASKEIALIRRDLEQEKQKKKALMQLLLTGIVRVNA